MNPTPPSGGLSLSSFAPLDWVGIVLVVLLVLMGLWRGMWWQIIRLAGLIAAVALARTFGADFSTWISRQWPDLSGRLAHGTAWVVIFLAALLVATLLGLFGQKLIEAMKLGTANRVGGGLIGALTGILIHLAVLVVICQLAPEAFVGRVMAGTYSEKLVETVGNRWPVVVDGEAAAEIERLLREQAGEHGLGGDDGQPPPEEPGR